MGFEVEASEAARDDARDDRRDDARDERDTYARDERGDYERDAALAREAPAAAAACCDHYSPFGGGGGGAGGAFAADAEAARVSADAAYASRVSADGAARGRDASQAYENHSLVYEDELGESRWPEEEYFSPGDEALDAEAWWANEAPLPRLSEIRIPI